MKNKVPTIGEYISPILKQNEINISISQLAYKLNMNIQTLEKILKQSFASDELISQIADALKIEPHLLESFKFSNVIINQIATANEGTTIHQNALSTFEKEMYERIIEQQNARLQEKDELIKVLKIQRGLE